MAVIGDGRGISEVADAWGVSRQTLHEWLARYNEALRGVDRLIGHRPTVLVV